MALVLYHTTWSVQLADLCGSFAAHASESLWILALCVAIQKFTSLTWTTATFITAKKWQDAFSLFPDSEENHPWSLDSSMAHLNPSNICLPSHLHFNTVLQDEPSPAFLSAIANAVKQACQLSKLQVFPYLVHSGACLWCPLPAQPISLSLLESQSFVLSCLSGCLPFPPVKGHLSCSKDNFSCAQIWVNFCQHLSVLWFHH